MVFLLKAEETEDKENKANITLDFTCHPDWIPGHQNMWISIISGVSVKVFLDEMSI